MPTKRTIHSMIRNPKIEELEAAGIMKKSVDITAPGKLHHPHQDQDAGGTVAFRGPTGCGKTIVMIARVFHIIESDDNFSGSRVFGNRWIDLAGYNYMCNQELKKLLYRAFSPDSPESGEWNGCIFLVFECDSLFTHLDSSDKELSRKFLNLSQATCYNTWVMTEYHEGIGVLRIIRDKTEIIVEPTYDKKNDRITQEIFNGQKLSSWDQDLENASSYFDYYKRRDPAI
jgi:hypothetical protein